MPEKLLTIREAAEHLKVPEEEVKRLVDIGAIPAYKIGGTFLRFRREQLDAIRSEISTIERVEPGHAKPILDSHGKPVHPYTDLEREIKRKEPLTRQYDYILTERMSDFFYFNDFYIVSLIIILVLVYFIFKA